MQRHNTTRSAVSSTALAGTESAAVDEAFETLRTYDWGTDRNTLSAIDAAVIATQGDQTARRDLEKRLVEVLTSGASRSAKDYVCRTLRTIGTAESVPALAALLPDQDLSHIARYALERIPAPKAAAAMRDALPSLSGKLKVGAIGSLGVRRDADSVAILAEVLDDSDASIVAAAANALGTIGTPQAGQILGEGAVNAPESVKPAMVDACLICAERLLADGKKADAIRLYKSLMGEEQPRHVRLAARRGRLTAAGK